MTKLIPLEDHIIVEAIEEEQKTASGIVLPDTSKEKPSKGRVVSVGAGKILDNGQRAAIDVKEGDVVYFTKYSPDELEVAGKKYLVIRSTSILAKEAE